MLAKRDVDFQALDLNVLVEDVIKLLSSDLLIHNIGIATDLSPDLPRVKGDRIQLQQVVLNLLLNAIDAISGDPSVNERRIVVRTAAQDRVHISVCDSGHGLPRDIRDLVFQPFFTTKSSGMGMGLTIARSIIEAHGGVIWATDNPVRGTTFHCALSVDPTAGSE
jgi:signal transduction histidine kinase